MVSISETVHGRSWAETRKADRFVEIYLKGLLKGFIGALWGPFWVPLRGFIQALGFLVKLKGSRKA